MERLIKTDNRFASLDLTIPIETDNIMAKVNVDDCFGKLWDIRTLECSKCAERDVCGIIFNSNVVTKKVAEVQEDQGAIFLDLTDFDNITKKKIFDWVDSGKTTAKDLIAYVMGLACTSDRTAAIEFLKRFITSTDGINTKKGIVWLA